jgi:hypothetical protein
MLAHMQMQVLRRLTLIFRLRETILLPSLVCAAACCVISLIKGMSNTRLWMDRFMRLRSHDKSKEFTRYFLLCYWQTLLFLISKCGIEYEGYEREPWRLFGERVFPCIKLAPVHVLSCVEQRPLETWVPSLVKKCSIFNASYCPIPKFQQLVDIMNHVNAVNVIYFRYALILSSPSSLGLPNDISPSGFSPGAWCGYLISHLAVLHTQPKSLSLDPLCQRFPTFLNRGALFRINFYGGAP